MYAIHLKRLHHNIRPINHSHLNVVPKSTQKVNKKSYDTDIDKHNKYVPKAYVKI